MSSTADAGPRRPGRRAQAACEVARNRHYDGATVQRQRLLSLVAVIGGSVTAGFGVMQLMFSDSFGYLGFVNLGTAALYAVIPSLYRFGELVAPLALIMVVYLSMTFVCWHLGTGTGVQFYFLIAAVAAVMVVGIERIGLAIAAAAVGVSLVITLEFSVPRDTGAEPPWFITVGFILNTIGAGVLAVAMVWYGLRQIASAEAAMEQEYQRSEALLANILPASIAERLKDRSNSVIADKYDDASILFADIAGYTERASDTSPEELVAFLDDLYTSLDALVARHGLEKVKTSGDAYMVVSGVPQPRPDHLEALADLALDIADAVAGLTDSRGRRAAADRYVERACGSRRGRVAALLLRRVGRRRQCRVPDGVHCGRWTHSSAAAGLRTTLRSLCLRGTRRHRGQGQGRHAYLVPGRPKRWPTRLIAKEFQRRRLSGVGLASAAEGVARARRWPITETAHSPTTTSSATTLIAACGDGCHPRSEKPKRPTVRDNANAPSAPPASAAAAH
jgi:adenylate cyclase